MGGKHITEGENFGKLTAIERVHRASASGRIRSFWVCRCTCGSLHEVESGNLRSGNTRWCKSCASKFKSSHRRVHGYSQYADGRNKARKEYGVWAAMKGRCENPNNPRYRDYGGRGISVCEEWRVSFVAFIRDMGSAPTKDHQIDRANNNGNYEPANCRWATRLENSNNKRNNRHVQKDGETLTVSQFAREAGLDVSTVLRRIGLGWPDEKLCMPVLPTNRRAAKPVLTPKGKYPSAKEAAEAYGKGGTWIRDQIIKGKTGWAYA